MNNDLALPATDTQVAAVQTIEALGGSLAGSLDALVPAPLGAIIAVALGSGVLQEVATALQAALSGELDDLLEDDANRIMARAGIKAIDAAAEGSARDGAAQAVRDGIARNLGNNVAVALAAFAAGYARYPAFSSAVVAARASGDVARLTAAINERASAVRALHVMAQNVALVTAGREPSSAFFPKGPSTLPQSGPANGPARAAEGAAVNTAK